MLVMFIIAYHNVPQNSKYRKHVNHIRYTCYKLKVQWIVNFGWLGWPYFLKTTIDKRGNWTPNPAAVSMPQLFSFSFSPAAPGRKNMRRWPGTADCWNLTQQNSMGRASDVQKLLEVIFWGLHQCGTRQRVGKTRAKDVRFRGQLLVSGFYLWDMLCSRVWLWR